MISKKGYHGTSEEAYESVLKEGFKHGKYEEGKFVVGKRNDKQWLGQGVYFFEDKDLAKWWVESKKNNFGNDFKNPYVVSVNIEVQDENFLDLTKIKDKNLFDDYYKKFRGFLFNKGKKLKNKNDDRFYCFLFDYVKIKYNYTLVRACFYKNNPKYLKHENCTSNPVNIIYPETQVCVFNSENEYNNICLLKGEKI